MNKKNNISWFRGWFLIFSPLLFFSYNFEKRIMFLYTHHHKYIKAICKADSCGIPSGNDGNTATGYSLYSTSIIKNKVFVLEFAVTPQNDGLGKIEENYLIEKWAYAHSKESNVGMGESSEQIAEKAKIKVWYHPKSSTAYVILEPKYEMVFPANEIIWRNLKWFIGFTILPLYFFCRWMIEVIRVQIINRNKTKND